MITIIIIIIINNYCYFRMRAGTRVIFFSLRNVSRDREFLISITASCTRPTPCERGEKKNRFLFVHLFSFVQTFRPIRTAATSPADGRVDRGAVATKTRARAINIYIFFFSIAVSDGQCAKN